MKKFLTLLILFMSTQVQAASTSPGPLFTYEGLLTDNAGNAITTTQSVTFQVLYGSCILFEETQTITPGTAGEFSVIVGTGTRVDSTGNTADRIFGSSGTVNCKSSSAVSLTGFATRSLHINVGGIDLSPDVTVGNIPMAINSQKLADKGVSDFALINSGSGVTQTNIENIFARYTDLNNLLTAYTGNTLTAQSAQTAVSFSGSLVGDVTGTQGATTITKIQGKTVNAPSPADGQVLTYVTNQWVPTTPTVSSSITALTNDVTASGSGSVAATVNSVGGSSAADIHTAELAANGASATNISNSIVRRDSSGDFTAGTITANLNGYASANVSKSGDTMTGNLTHVAGTGDIYTAGSGANTATIQGPTGAIGTSYVLRLPTNVATSNGQVLTSDTSGNLSWSTASGGSVTSTSVATANGFGGTVATATTTPAITITTSVSGMAKGDGTALLTATPGTDYSLGTSALATGIVKSTTSTGALSIAGSADIISTLGYTPVNKSGDSMIGQLTFPANIGSVYTAGTGANTVAIQGPTNSIGTSYVLKLPTSVASSNGQVLTSDTSGNLSWSTPSTTATAYSGILPVANGGTNSSATLGGNRIMVSNGTAIVESNSLNDGQILIGSTGSAPQVANLTAGSGVTITNAPGSITISATSGGGGTVTNVTASSPLSVISGATTPDISITPGTITGQVLRWDGASYWTAAQLNYTDLVNSTLSNPWPTSSCAAGEAITWSSISDSFTCSNLVASISGNSTLADGKIWIGNGSNTATESSISGDATITNSGALSLTNSGVTAGTWNSVTVDAKGRVTAGTNPTTLSGYGITDAVKNAGSAKSIQTGTELSKPTAGTIGRLYFATDTQKIYYDDGSSWSLVASNSASGGTVTNIATGTGLTGGPISLSGTISLADTAVASGTYGSATQTPTFTVDAQGRLTAASNTAIAIPWSAVNSRPTSLSGYGITDAIKNGGSVGAISSGLDSFKPGSPSTGEIYIASDSLTIYRYNGSSWDTLSSATGSGGTITGLSGDVTAGGNGYVSATVNSVGGSSASSINAAVNTINAATDTNTASTIVKRDATGNFAANTITANQFVGSATNNVLKAGDTMAGSLTFASGAGSIYTANTGSNTVTLKGPTNSISTSYVLRLPTSLAAADGQVLSSDTSGNLSWTTPSGGSVTSVSVTTGNGFVASVSSPTTSPSISLSTSVSGLIKGSSGALQAASASDITSLLGYTPVNKSGDTMNGNLTFASSKSLIFNDSSSNTISILAPSTITSSYVLKLPQTAATSGQFLSSDGSGNLTWVNQSTTATSYSGTLPVVNGGTNSNAALNNKRIMISSGGAIVEAPALADGQILIGSSTAAPVAANLTAGTGITITNSAGGISIANSGGTVTNVTGTAPISVSNNTTTPTISMVSGTVAGQVNRWSGSSWTATKLIYTDLLNSLVASPWPSTACAAGQAIVWNSGSDNFSCSSITIPTSQISGILPLANGGTGSSTGSITAPGALTFTSGTSQNITLNPSGGAINLNGKVGMGTASPTTYLEVAGPGTTIGQIQVKDAGYDYTNTLLRSFIQGTDSLSNPVWYIGDKNPSTKDISIGTGTTGYNLNLDTGGSTRMRISETGAIGINTTTPNIVGIGPGPGTVTISGAGTTNTDGGFLELNTPWVPGGYTIGGKIAFTASQNPGSTLLASIQGNVPAGSGGANGYGGQLVFTTKQDASLSVNQMVYSAVGYLGIGGITPTSMLHITGAGLATAWNLSSDVRLKENITAINSPLEKILQLRGVEFDWRTDVNQPTKHDRKHDIGVIAQEVEAIFPEAVTTASDGFKSVAYSKLVSPLIGSVHELYGMCKASEEQLNSIDRRLASIEEDSKAKDLRIQKLEEENALLKKDLELIKAKLGL